MKALLLVLVFVAAVYVMLFLVWNSFHVFIPLQFLNETKGLCQKVEINVLRKQSFFLLIKTD